MKSPPFFSKKKNLPKFKNTKLKPSPRNTGIWTPLFALRPDVVGRVVKIIGMDEVAQKEVNKLYHWLACVAYCVFVFVFATVSFFFLVFDVF